MSQQNNEDKNLSTVKTQKNTSEDKQFTSQINSFSLLEEKILKFWKENEAFETSDILSENRPSYVFYEGPPFATGLPHYGHILASTIKDTVTRYYYQKGYHVTRNFGWDCHGLPVEYEIDKKLGISTREEIIEMGIDKYNQKCRDVVLMYSTEWEKVISRLGRWISFKNNYRTMDTPFMESVWNIFKMLYDKDLIYRGYRVMPFSTACSTPLSNFEANQNYKEVSDPSILIKFPLLKPFHHKKVSLLAWTTTPWTLPSNCALLVNTTITYGIFEYESEFFIMSVDRLSSFNLKFTENSNSKKIILEPKRTEILNSKFIATFLGTDLLNLEYEPPFSYFINLREKGYFKVYSADFVSNEDGTGIVHCAPAFGEEDYKAFVSNNLIKENDIVPCPVNDKGKFTSQITEYQGQFVKEADKLIIKDLKHKILLNNRITHRYPFCWRSDTPLIYKLVPNWFVKVKDSTQKLLTNNEIINWIPQTIKYKKFHNWLMNAKDWSISRNRFWGTPLPLWTNTTYNKIICIGSIKELEEYIYRYGDTKTRQKYMGVLGSELSEKLRSKEEYELGSEVKSKEEYELGSEVKSREEYELGSEVKSREGENAKHNNTIKDIHREFIDDITFVVEGEEYRRVDEVLDCWFESGSMPYAQKHWPFSNNDLNKEFPADFIGEGADQTRGWFYTLHVISSLLFNKPAFKNVVVNGIVLAEDGRKMSKRLKNYPDPSYVINTYGSDSLRMYLISSPVVEAENLRFNENGVKEILKNLIIPWHNALNFYKQCVKGGCVNNRDMSEGVNNKSSEQHPVSDSTNRQHPVNTNIDNYHPINTNIDNYQPVNSSLNTQHPFNTLSPMDEWILTSFNNLVFNITTKMNGYIINGVLTYILKFIDDLTNWYIRINRVELKKGKLEVLRYILVNLSIIMAPFTPFYSEYCFQEIKGCYSTVNRLKGSDTRDNKEVERASNNTDNTPSITDPNHINTLLYRELLTGNFLSVHYLMYPVVEEFKAHSFEKAKDVIEGVRTMRVFYGISLKTPLNNMKVICREEYWEGLLEYKGVIKRECNILEMGLELEDTFCIKIVVKPNFKEINSRCSDKREVGVKIKAIRNMNDEEIKGVISSGKLVKDSVVIFHEELIIDRVIDGGDKGFFFKGWELKVFPWFSILLDIQMTGELIEMKEAREFNSFYQKMRKGAGLSLQDNVFLTINGADDLVELCNKFYDFKICEHQGKVITSNKYKYKDKDVDITLSKM